MDSKVTEDTGSKPTTSPLLKNDGGKTAPHQIEVPALALPKGGGAIQGIDEKFSVNAANGTAGFAVPLPFSPARGSAAPALDLAYSSGGGNGVFGLGWDLSLPSIKRKTANELPQYAEGSESDTYLFAGAEDLVPEFKKVAADAASEFELDEDGNYQFKELYPPHSPDPHYAVRFYRPRIEGLFARIERWTHITSGAIKWRVITRDNVTTLLGWSEASRIADPADPNRIFEWQPEFVFDDQGNCAHYVYKQEDAAGLDESLQQHRNKMQAGQLAYTNLYLEKVLYGNKNPYKLSCSVPCGPLTKSASISTGSLNGRCHKLWWI